MQMKTRRSGCMQGDVRCAVGRGADPLQPRGLEADLLQLLRSYEGHVRRRHDLAVAWLFVYRIHLVLAGQPFGELPFLCVTGHGTRGLGLAEQLLPVAGYDANVVPDQPAPLRPCDPLELRPIALDPGPLHYTPQRL